MVSAVSIDPRASDQQLVELAIREDRVLVTEDKDFGELVFIRRLPHGPIVRVVELAVDQQVRGIGELLDQYVDELTGPVMVTITRGRIRIRRGG